MKNSFWHYTRSVVGVVGLFLISTITSAQSQKNNTSGYFEVSDCAERIVNAMNELIQIRNADPGSPVHYASETYRGSDRIKLNSIGSFRYKGDEGHYKVLPLSLECTCTNTGFFSNRDKDNIVHNGIPEYEDFCRESSRLNHQNQEQTDPALAVTLRYKNSINGFTLLWSSGTTPQTPYQLGMDHGLPNDAFLDQTLPGNDNHLYDFNLYMHGGNIIPLNQIEQISNPRVTLLYAYDENGNSIRRTEQNPFNLLMDVKLKDHDVPVEAWIELKNNAYSQSGYLHFITYRTANDAPIIIMSEKRYVRKFRKKEMRILRPFIKNAGEDYLVQWFKDDSQIPFCSGKEIDLAREFKKEARYGTYTAKVISALNGTVSYSSIEVINGDEPEYAIPSKSIRPQPQTALANQKTSVNLQISPNPASEMIRISSQKEIQNEQSTLRIYNLSGQMVTERALSKGNQHSIAVSDLPNGSYLLQRIYLNGTVEQGKLMIQH